MLRRLAFGFACLTWIAVILLIALPWRDLRDHTHWGKVAWIPFVSPPIKIVDIVGNVLLYLPLGYLGQRTINRRTGMVLVVAAAAMISLGAEATQLFSHRRFPSATDLTCNLGGAAAGVYFAQPSRRRARTHRSQEIRS